MAADLIARLLEFPPAFAHPLTAPRCIETHVSWVLLAGDYAYKFKKPVTLAFLDYATPALRRFACEEECRINRRTAPDIYLGVVAVVGTLAAPRIVPAADVDATTPVLDWAVRMRRFPDDALLSRRVARGAPGGLRAAEVDRLAAAVAAFHLAAVAPPSDPAWGTAAGVRAEVAANFDALRGGVGGVGGGALAATLASVEAWSTQEGERLAERIAQRRREGWVRECHGDLHLGNLLLIDGEVRLFDAIEFNPGFRWIDVMADLAFLLMDLRANDRDDLAWRLLNGYLERTGDYGGLAVLRYYMVYRAMVRAKVALLALAQQSAGGDDRAGDGAAAASAASREQLARYLHLAARIARPGDPAVWLATGVSGSGKSSQTQALIEARGIVRIKADVERKRLFGLPAEARSAAPGVGGGIYSAEATTRTYARLVALAGETVGAGWPVLVDATCLRRTQRQMFIQLAQTLGVPCRILALEAPPVVLRERVRQRAATGRDPSEADLAVLEAQLAQREALSAEELACAVTVDTRDLVDWPAVLPAAWAAAG